MRETAPNLLDSCEKIVAAVREVRRNVNESYDDIIASMEAIQGQNVLYEEIFKGSKDAILVLHADTGIVLVLYEVDNCDQTIRVVKQGLDLVVEGF